MMSFHSAPGTLPRPLVITMGDPAGIGPEIVMSAVRQRPALLEQVVVACDVPTLRRACDLVGAKDGKPTRLCLRSAIWMTGPDRQETCCVWCKPARAMNGCPLGASAGSPGSLRRSASQRLRVGPCMAGPWRW